MHATESHMTESTPKDPQESSGQPGRTISVLIASRNRPSEVRKCIDSVLTQTLRPLEIIVLDDASDPPLKEGVALESTPVPVHWLRSDAPSGVTGARNKIVEAATGDILVFIDDDAWLVGPDQLARISEHFGQENAPGIVAFKIHLNEHGSGELQVPFTRSTISGDPEIANRKQNASYFVGAGHAISKQVFDECGLYPVEFIYGHEELDLSYRAINRDFTVLYDPAIEVVHAPAASQIAGAGKKRFESYYVTRNRLWLAYRNLPWRYAITYSIAWSGYYLLKSLRHGQLFSWFSAIKDGVFGVDRSQRHPLSKRAVSYISQHHGRLWR